MHRPIAHLVLFACAGPIVGELSWFTTLFLSIPDFNFRTIYFSLFFFVLFFAYLFGLVPAALTGLSCSLVMGWLYGSARPHLIAQVVMGTISGALLTAAVTFVQLRPDASQMDTAIEFTRDIWPHGALAGAVCSLVAWFLLKTPNNSFKPNLLRSTDNMAD